MSVGELEHDNWGPEGDGGDVDIGDASMHDSALDWFDSIDFVEKEASTDIGSWKAVDTLKTPSRLTHDPAATQLMQIVKRGSPVIRQRHAQS